MPSRSEILTKLQNLKGLLADKYPISTMALFGSFARGEHSEHSDIDILVEINGRLGSRFIDLADELENSLGCKVDLVSKRGIKPYYLRSIESDLIYV